MDSANWFGPAERHWGVQGKPAEAEVYRLAGRSSYSPAEYDLARGERDRLRLILENIKREANQA